MWSHWDIRLHTRSSHRLAQIQTHSNACRTRTTKSCGPTQTHAESHCFIFSLALSLFFVFSPWRAQFRWNVTFNGNGKWNNKKHFFFYCIPVKREKVFLLDGTTQALTHGSYGIWQWIPPRAENIAFIAVISKCRVKLDCFSEEH